MWLEMMMYLDVKKGGEGITFWSTLASNSSGYLQIEDLIKNLVRICTKDKSASSVEI